MSCNNCQIKFKDFYSENIYTWCTNCGNYGIHAALKRALIENDMSPKDILLAFDIGCNGNGADKINGYTFHGLHGRVLPFAAGASITNRKVKVIASGGDGATLGEGINHLIHTVRSNYNFTFILHNNGNYGLTKGQASPASKKDIPMDSSPDGVQNDPINACKLVLGLNPSFVARTFSGDVKHMTKTINAAIKHNGFSFVEILQNCPTYNKATPHEWYQNRVFDIQTTYPSYDVSNIQDAKEIAEDLEFKIAMGIIYKAEKPSFNDLVLGNVELVDSVKAQDVSRILNSFI